MPRQTVTESKLTSPFLMEDLLHGVKALKNNKAAGLDDMLCEQIKHFGEATLRWLLQMMNSILKTQKFPKLWRKSKVIAILKPGKDSTLPKSYRPISLLCHTYKLFERMILNRLNPLIETMIIDQQAGFRPWKSTTTQLDTTHWRWLWARCGHRNRVCWSISRLRHNQPQATTEQNVQNDIRYQVHRSHREHALQ